MLSMEEAREKLDEIKVWIQLTETTKLDEPYIKEWRDHLKRLERAYEKEFTEAVSRRVSRPTEWWEKPTHIILKGER